MQPVRIRLAFRDRHVLSKIQRREGLQHCWVLLRPELETVAALTSHIVHSFGLQDSCPDGLVLSMHQFVIPAFETTGIFKDKDIVSIRVRKREGGVKETRLKHELSNLIEDSKIINKQPLCLCNCFLQPVLRNEPGGCLEEGGSVDCVKTFSLESTFGGKRQSKRKKYCNWLVYLRRKRAKLNRPGENPTFEAATNARSDQEENHSQQDDMQQKRPSTTCRLSDNYETSNLKTIEVKDMCHILKERHDESQENINGYGRDKKVSSRSARRKKAKRKWLHELKNSGKKELVQSVTQEEETEKTSEVHHVLDHDNDFEEVVPVAVKPGHIRFLPLGQNVQSPVKDVETLTWSGTVSKRKGQKWGREENFNFNNDDNILCAKLNVSPVANEVGDDKRNQLTEFEKLFPLTRLPKEGDKIAYRVVELSSSRCPEISSFRVGKVTSYDPASRKIILVQLLEFPVPCCKTGEGSVGQLDESLYKEDGSLEIDFPSLFDVRLLEEAKATSSASINERETTASTELACAQEPGSSSRTNHKEKGVAQSTDFAGIVGRGEWEGLCRALDAKKAELSREKGWTGWDEKDITSTNNRSRRVPRWGSVGSTVSMLRSTGGL